ncbi:MAG TPA: M48 family metalloprotease [Steroidobacteraceae bacterium]
MKLLPVFAAVMVASCATTTTQLAPIAREEVEAEEANQRELVLLELAKAQDRLHRLAYPLLAAATPVCSKKTGYRFGFSYRTVHDYKGPWVSAARSALGLSDTVSVVSVIAGSRAEHAGMQQGDRIVAINGVDIPIGRNASAAVASALEKTNGADAIFDIVRDGAPLSLTIAPETVCDLGLVVTAEGDINAYADGRNIIFPWAMMRFANDDELRVVIGHEIAHNAMGHLEARRKNAAIGAILGAIADVALATQGVNTGGEYSASFMRAGAQAFSQDFEREADYVGMYIMARAGVPLATGPNLWRQFAQISPSAIGYASTHPTTAERFVRLRSTIEEIERKRSRGVELLPEMRTRR